MMHLDLLVLDWKLELVVFQVEKKRLKERLEEEPVAFQVMELELELELEMKMKKEVLM